MSFTDLMKHIGENIRTARKSKNLTLEALGSLCDFEKASLSRIEQGKGNPSLRTLIRIADALEVEVSTFFI